MLIAVIVNSPHCFLSSLVIILFCQSRLLKCGSSTFFFFSVNKKQRPYSSVTPLNLLVTVMKNCGEDVKGGVLGSLEGLCSNVFP